MRKNYLDLQTFFIKSFPKSFCRWSDDSNNIIINITHITTTTSLTIVITLNTPNTRQRSEENSTVRGTHIKEMGVTLS